MKTTIIMRIILGILIIASLIIPNFSYARSTAAGAVATGIGAITNPGSDTDLDTNLNVYIGNNGGSDNITEKAGYLLGMIQIVGVVISVVMLVAIGIKYMLASVEEKADYKQTMIPYLIGAFLIFTGTTIPQLIYQFMKNF